MDLTDSFVRFRFHSENAGFLSLILFGNLWRMKVAGCSTFSLFDFLFISKFWLVAVFRGGSS